MEFRKYIVVIMFFIFSTAGFCNSTDEVFEYQKAVIQSLEWAKEAHEFLNAKRAENDWEGVIADSVFAQEKIKNAANSLTKFSKSDNKSIKDSQAILETVYLSIYLDIDQSVKFLEKLLNGEKTKRGSNAKEMAKIGVAAHESWVNLVSTTIVATYSLIDDERKVNDTTPYLVITKNQRNELIKELERSFGNDIKDGPKAGQHSPQAAAASIYKTLMEQGFKMSDE